MITERQPTNWRDLQREVARLLAECGMNTEVEKSVALARGTAEVDVVAIETVQHRTYTIYCECKFWASSIPQNVVHGFRTVVADGGANVGYVITSSAFQRGAFTAADLTNLKLLTWNEFQVEFEATWIDNHLRAVVTQRLDPLLSLTEPIIPRAFDELSDPQQDAFMELRAKYVDLGAIVMLFTKLAKHMFPSVPVLPLRGRLSAKAEANVPADLLDATAYGDFLDILVPLGEGAIKELRAALHPERKSSPVADQQTR